MELLKPQEAARMISVSYPTLKQWIYKGQIQSIKTPGGHHRIPRSEVDRLSSVRQSSTRKKSGGLDLISARNKLLGSVSEVKYEGLMAQVTINVGGQSVTSIITRDSCQELGLKRGVRAFALIKSTEVMIVRG
ncbi:MAG TPA: helix-turn-helix transcriptional regulator [Blastocatellia bacterium]|nr:helix-turn-helix transcriptional regulator [Blastocatellia bacterium]